MRKHHKITLAALALLATLLFFSQGDKPAPPPVQPIPASGEAEAAHIQPARTLVAALPLRAEMPQFRGDLFSAENKSPRQGARRVIAAEVLRPTAAVNPYRFAGELRQPGATRRFLLRGDDILEVKAGDVLGDGYRVDAAGESEVVLVHVASGLRHSIALGTPAPAGASATPAPAALGAPGTRTPPKALREG